MTSPPDSSETCEITLPERLDFAACEALAGQFAAAQNSSLRIAAGAVAHLGALPAEMLLRARAACAEGGQSFDLADPSEGFIAGLGHLGLDIEDFADGGSE